MPWKETSAMQQRKQFLLDWEMDARVGRVNLAALCRAYGISRPTAYKWIGRYLQARGRLEALAERSRRPLSSPEAIPDDVVDLLVKARKARPYWGPVTLRRWLINRGEDETRLPAPSTIGAILKRHGLVRPRQRRWRTPPSMGTKPSVEADCPNAVWCIDYKGHFRTADGQLCYPLTLIDGYSRYLLRCEGLPSTDERRAREVLESAFREFGLPARIRSVLLRTGAARLLRPGTRRAPPRSPAAEAQAYTSLTSRPRSLPTALRPAGGVTPPVTRDPSGVRR
jgi:putative transposase